MTLAAWEAVKQDKEERQSKFPEKIFAEFFAIRIMENSRDSFLPFQF